MARPNDSFSSIRSAINSFAVLLIIDEVKEAGLAGVAEEARLKGTWIPLCVRKGNSYSKKE